MWLVVHWVLIGTSWCMVTTLFWGQSLRARHSRESLRNGTACDLRGRGGVLGWIGEVTDLLLLGAWTARWLNLITFHMSLPTRQAA